MGQGVRVEECIEGGVGVGEEHGLRVREGIREHL